MQRESLPKGPNWLQSSIQVSPTNTPQHCDPKLMHMIQVSGSNICVEREKVTSWPVYNTCSRFSGWLYCCLNTAVTVSAKGKGGGGKEAVGRQDYCPVKATGNAAPPGKLSHVMLTVQTKINTDRWFRDCLRILLYLQQHKNYNLQYNASSTDHVGGGGGGGGMEGGIYGLIPCCCLI